MVALLCLSFGWAWFAGVLTAPNRLLAVLPDGISMAIGFESIARNSGHAQAGYRFVPGFMGQCLEFRTSSNGFVISEPPVFQSESFTVEFGYDD